MSTEDDLTTVCAPAATPDADQGIEPLLDRLKALADEAASRGIDLRRLNATSRFLRLTAAADFDPQAPEVMMECLDAQTELRLLLYKLREDSKKRDARVAAVRRKIWIAVIAAFLGGVGAMKFCSYVRKTPAPAVETDRGCEIKK